MLDLIEQAARVLEDKIRYTPVEYSPSLSKLVGQPVYLKLECLQLTGSFKIRGGFFYLSILSAAERKRGVAICSAGNHGLGVSYAGKQLQVPCTVFVPRTVDQAKYEKIIEMGAQVKKSPFAGYDDTLEWATQEAKKLHIPLIPTFDDEKIMAANGGTLAKETLAQVPDATHFVLPMGGGGLAGGFAAYAKAKNPQSKILITQLAACPALKLSLEQNKPMTRMPPIDTLAGGIEGGLGAKCFEILKTRVDGIAHISEQELRQAVCWFLEHHQYLIEPSASIALAACLYGHLRPNGPTVIILSGRNVGYSTLRQLLNTP